MTKSEVCRALALVGQRREMVMRRRVGQLGVFFLLALKAVITA